MTQSPGGGIQALSPRTVANTERTCSGRYAVVARDRRRVIERRYQALSGRSSGGGRQRAGYLRSPRLRASRTYVESRAGDGRPDGRWVDLRVAGE